MAGNTDISSLPYPTLGDPPDIEEAVKPLAEAVDSLVIPRYSTTTERDGAIPSPVDGQVVYVTTHGLQTHKSDWKPFPGTLVFKALRTATMSITNNSFVAIQYDTEEIDLLGGWASSPNPERFTPPVAGWYELTGGTAWDASSAGVRAVLWRVNGINVNGGAVYAEPAGSGATVAAAKTIPVQLNGTDYVELVTHQNSGGTLNSSHSAATVYSYMAAKFLQAS